MDQVLRMQAQGYTLRKLELEDVAAVARCYRAPYHTYGRIKAHLDEFGKLPPAAFRLPELQAAGLRGSVVQCSEYAKKNKRRTG